MGIEAYDAPFDNAISPDNCVIEYITVADDAAGTNSTILTDNG